MSADNGIYILQTPRTTTKGWEYRVAHLMAVENLYWDGKSHNDNGDENVQISNARMMWGKSPVYRSRIAALRAADRLHEDIGYTEYGISFITIRKRF